MYFMRRPRFFSLDSSRGPKHYGSPGLGTVQRFASIRRFNVFISNRNNCRLVNCIGIECIPLLLLSSINNYCFPSVEELAWFTNVFSQTKNLPRTPATRRLRRTLKRDSATIRPCNTLGFLIYHFLLFIAVMAVFHIALNTRRAYSVR